jgi:hypothetical protein
MSTRWRFAAVPLLLALTAASASAQSSRFALEPVASIDASNGSDVPRYTQLWFEVFAAFRIADGLDVVARPVVNRRTFDGVWQKQMYQLGLRYERPGRIGLRLEAGQLPSPIGIGMLENRPDLNPLITQHSAYYLPLPRVDPEIPRVYLIAGAYPLGAQATVSSGAWDARVAVTDSSPVRGRPFFHANGQPRLRNTVAGVGFKPLFGMRIGAAVAHGAYASVDEVVDTTRGDRDATMMQLEAEWSFGYTRLAGELVRSVMETAARDAVAQGGWLEGTQTLTPRWFVSSRIDWQEFTFQRPQGYVDAEYYKRFEAIAGFRLTPAITLRGGYLVRKGYVVSHWDDQMVLALTYHRKVF